MKTKLQIQIRFKDIDQMGHVNNANYFTYFELARVEYFKEVMQTRQIEWKTEGIIMANVEMTFLKPLLLEDAVWVYTWISRIGTKSFNMDCSVVKRINGLEVEVAKGSSVIVCINYETNETIAIPDLWVQKIKDFESRPSV